MAVNVIKPKLIADTAVKFLEKATILGPCVWTNGVGDFAGKHDDTINIRVELPGTAYRRDLRASGENRKIELSNLTEVTIPVKLTDRLEHAVELTDEEDNLDIENFARKVLARQIRAVGQLYEQDLADLIEGADYDTVHAIDENKPYNAFVDAATQLSMANVDTEGRTLVVGAQVAATLRKSAQWSDASKAGDNSAFRRGLLGTIDGMTPVIGSNHIDPYAAYLFHRTAFVAAHRAPKVPRGAYSGASVSGNGLAIRWINDYDADYAIDRSILTVWTGYERITEDTTTGVTGPFVRGTKLLLPGGGS